MPTKPTSLKMFFCRITQPYDDTIWNDIPLYIQTKFYKHFFAETYYVHETGIKTDKPHYHLLILCKTTKIEIQKWIKANFKVDGNKEYSVTDKYKIETKDISLAYMLKGGLNTLYEFTIYKPGFSTTPIDEDEYNYYIDTDKYNEIIEIFKKSNEFKTIVKDDKFEYYMTLVKSKICGNYGDINVIMRDLDYADVLRKIYYVLIKDAIAKCKRIMRCNLWDWSFTLTLHLCSTKEQDKLIRKTIDNELDKKLTII